METKSLLYAAVGAPVVAARKVKTRVDTLKDKISQEKTGYTEAAEKAINEWAAEGEKVVTRIQKGKVVEEISAKVDFEQAKEQVGKLRDQIEDILVTWRASFRPEQGNGGVEVKEADSPAETAEKTSEKAAKTSPANKPATKASAAAKSTAAKTSSAKTTKTAS